MAAAEAASATAAAAAAAATANGGGTTHPFSCDLSLEFASPKHAQVAAGGFSGLGLEDNTYVYVSASPLPNPLSTLSITYTKVQNWRCGL